MEGSFKGILYPARLPTFNRVPAPASVADLVQWFWIPEWDIEPGRTSRQHLIAYPASNLVVQPADVVFSGPTTRAAHRDLTGSGWAVGALLRPAAVPLFTDDPGAMRDSETELALTELHAAVSDAMAPPRGAGTPPSRHPARRRHSPKPGSGGLCCVAGVIGRSALGGSPPREPDDGCHRYRP